MHEVRACRVCLATRVTLLQLRPGAVCDALFKFYTHLTGGLSWGSHVQYVCSLCWRLLQRAHDLRRICLTADALLTAILQDRSTITQEAVERVDRESNQLVWPLQIHHNGFNAIEVVYEECSEFKNECHPEKNYDEEGSEIWLPDAVEEVKSEPATPLADAWQHQHSATDSEDDRPVARFASVRIVADDDQKNNVANKRRRKRKTKTSKPETDFKEKKRHKRFDASSYEKFCTVVFMSKQDATEEIRKRMDSSNYLMSTYRCDLCYRGFWQQQSYNNHMLKHDPRVGEHECEVCKLRFESARSLHHHTANFHRTKFICNKCPHYSTNPPLARRHEDWHQGKLYTCKHCNETFKRVSTLQSHVRRLHASEFSCELCGLTFVGRRGIVAHKTRMHRQEQRQVAPGSGHRCDDCGLIFANETAFKIHLVVSPKHRGQTLNGCEICGETFKTADELKLHHRSHARKYPALYLNNKKNNGISWPVECEQCKAKMSNSQEYKSHFQREHPDKNRTHFPVWRSSYMCETCGRVFRNQALLGYHQRKHSGEKPHKCDTCGKTFYHASHLTAHARMHSGDMPYSCSICGKRFNYKNNLERHMNIHSGVKPHKCEYCGKCFTQSSERKSHVDYVHHKKPWPKRDRARRRTDAALFTLI